MKSSIHDLESISFVPLQTALCQSFWSGLQNIWQDLNRSFNTSLELQVWRVFDRQGHISWSAYNPKNGQSIKRISEEQMRIWIEQNYR